MRKQSLKAVRSRLASLLPPQHAMVRGIVCLLVRFLVIKQDPRIERPVGRGDGNWLVIGGIPGSKWCILKWINLLNCMHGPSPDKDGPMFLNKDRQRPYTYGNFSRDYDSRQRRVGLGEADITHPHGIRVWAYNRVRELLGRGIAAAHGGWAQPEDKPALATGNSRYDRFLLSLVVRIAACIAGTDMGDFLLGEVSEEPGSLRVPAGEIRERAAAKPKRMGRAEVRVSQLAIEALGFSRRVRMRMIPRIPHRTMGCRRARSYHRVGRRRLRRRSTGGSTRFSRVLRARGKCSRCRRLGRNMIGW